jgi:hypothetical protein
LFDQLWTIILFSSQLTKEILFSYFLIGERSIILIFQFVFSFLSDFLMELRSQLSYSNILRLQKVLDESDIIDGSIRDLENTEKYQRPLKGILKNNTHSYVVKIEKRRDAFGKFIQKETDYHINI